ncbi:thiol reductant ABC exporter subunit CydD [Paenibacillus sp. KACC 21273]|uniref:thiol reductant ABC exporter subunit CydD n=1 Tax=Paenibacillus sp. KACC 21273 TaxID=3025665 RepID=UPI00236710C5|nr:thiol reductant ABC exporter subunit CydD [Paenibacillus sp. KACC 21273]WDF52992.1 thiol reductant ABC exporter subunit CydD [Paenibacillus sp. KACC 21273]
MGKGLIQLQGIKPIMALTGLFTFVQTIVIIMQSLWLAEAVSGLFTGDSLHRQLGHVFGFVGALVVRQLLSVIMQKIAYDFAERTGRSMRKLMMDQLFELGPTFAIGQGTGNLVTLVREGVSKYRTYLELIIPRMMSNSLTPLLIGIFILKLDWISALILGAVFPLLIIFMILLGLAAQKQMDKQWATYRVLSNHFVDSLRGLETLRFLGRSRAHEETIGRTSERYRKATISSMRVAFLSSFALDFFTMLSVACVAVSLGLRLVHGTIILEPALTILILAPEFFVPIRSLGADYHATMDGKEAGEDIQRIIHTSTTIGTVDAQNTSDMYRSKPVWSASSQMVLNQLSVQHDAESNFSLEQLNLRIGGYCKIGIIGESGAGKSTLIDVLSGFLTPTQGEVLWKDSLGESYPLNSNIWRQQTTYIPQHPYLFSGTLADNLRLYEPEATDEQLWQVIRDTGLYDLVSQLPQGIEEPVGGAGRTLSGGQEQRVALARALLGQRQIMLLDEPTAHLDIETEYELKQTMLELFNNRFVILATHRMHWMVDMDWIIVLEHGQIVEQGTHEQLLAHQGAYCRLIDSQWGESA